MAGSNHTKRLLAGSLKSLMQEQPFEKISVAEISQRCGMNRKSFYYHFQDKYALVNWIFDTEFSAMLREREPADQWDFLRIISEYFYQNRAFYRKALLIQGQNSFSEHFRALLQPALRKRAATLLDTEEVHPFLLDLYADFLYCAVTRWLQNKDCMPPEQFVSMLGTLMKGVAASAKEDLQPQGRKSPAPGSVR